MKPPRGRLRGRLLIFGRAAKVWLGARRQPPGELRRVLIAHHLLLGDTLMLTPLLAKLRQCHPEAEVVMAVPEAIAPLYQNRPYGVDALPWNPRAPQTSPLFQEDGFDLALVPGDNRYAWLALALGARWIRAFAGDRPAYKSWPVDQLQAYVDAPGAWGDWVAELIEGPPPAPYTPSDWTAPAARTWDRPAGDYAVLHLGASSALKQWPSGRWQALAGELAAAGIEPIWSAGRGEETLVLAADPRARWRSYAGRLDLPQLWQLLAGARLLVCPDTGVAHLGRVVGVPTIALFGPGSSQLCGAGNFWRNSPYCALTVAPFPCRDQQLLFKRELSWVRRCARSSEECAAPRCMEALELPLLSAAAAQLGLEFGPRPSP